MDQQLKTRLIGATIIVSLVVIFVPMLFEDGSSKDSETAAGAPDFPQASFDSQALPLPGSMPSPASQGRSVVDEPLAPMPSRSEPLDPLDVPAAAEADGDELGAPRQGIPEEPLAPPVRSEPKAPVIKPAAPARLAAEEAPVKPKAEPAKPAPAPAKTPVPPAAKAVAPAAKPAAPAAGKLSAWVVQAGSFADENNAKTLLFKLRQAKIPAFVEMIPSPSGNTYRVRVGPELDRARAEAIQKKMESEAGVKGMIVSYP